MKTLLSGSALVLFLAFCGGANGQEIVKKEPPAGALSRGGYVYVDDGSCPKGQIKKVTAGVFSGSGRSARAVGSPRTRTCVPHP